MAVAGLNVCLLVLLVVVTLSDIRHRLIPDVVLLAGGVAGLTVVGVALPATLPTRIAAAAAAGAFLLMAALIKPGAMGLGDVKLGSVLGLYLGWGVASALLLSFAAGSIAGLGLIVRRGWSARSQTIPFAPCLALGAIVVMAAQP